MRTALVLASDFQTGTGAAGGGSGGTTDGRERGQRQPRKALWFGAVADGATDAAALVTGVLVKRADSLLVNAGFVAGLEEAFGIEPDGAAALIGETLAALFPAEFGDDAEQAERTARAMADRHAAECERLRRESEFATRGRCREQTWGRRVRSAVA